MFSSSRRYSCGLFTRKFTRRKPLMKAQLFFTLVVAGLLSVPVNAQLVIGFHTGSTTAVSGGTFSYDGVGGPLIGNDIPLELLTSINTPANAGSYHVSNGSLSFTS